MADSSSKVRPADAAAPPAAGGDTRQQHDAELPAPDASLFARVRRASSRSVDNSDGSVRRSFSGSFKRRGSKKKGRGSECKITMGALVVEQSQAAISGAGITGAVKRGDTRAVRGLLDENPGLVYSRDGGRLRVRAEARRLDQRHSQKQRGSRGRARGNRWGKAKLSRPN